MGGATYRQQGIPAIPLTSTIVNERLSFHRLPCANEKSQIVDFEPNGAQKGYFVFNSHGDAPAIFWRAVNRTDKSYSFQRRIGDRVPKARIGNVRDM